jgi:ubiquinol-cytochrome c reductase iron-sulfur subunit
MTESASNMGRRKLLIAATSAVGAVGVVGAAVPFVRSWNPSAKAKAAGAPVEANISKLAVGQKLVVEWRGRPVWIVRRSEKSLKDLEQSVVPLRDPNSNESKQPEFAHNVHRSIKPEYLVLTGLCTHLGCSPTYRPEVGAADLGGSEWLGGFFCPCHGSKFDLAGRVYKGVPAPTNLEVPPYYFVNDEVVLIGESASPTSASPSGAA